MEVIFYKFYRELIKLWIIILLTTQQVCEIYYNRNEKYKNNYDIYKNGFSDDILTSIMSKGLSIDEIKELKDSVRCPEKLNDIFCKFSEYVTLEELENCLMNINHLIFEDNIFANLSLFLGQLGVVGAYYPEKNAMTVLCNFKSIVAHEFLHMASTSYKNRNLSGFGSISSENSDGIAYKFGTGLNEGYTELLTRRIFFDGKKGPIYYFNVKIVRLIECFFDDNSDMEKAYFQNDIDAVYRQFCKFGTRDEFFCIMNWLDFFSDTFAFDDYKHFIAVQYNLYDIIKRSNDCEKIAKFESILFESNTFKLFKNHDITFDFNKSLKKGLIK